MRIHQTFSLPTRLVLVLVCVSATAACDILSDVMWGPSYEGPQPAAESIIGEYAVVRRINVPPSGPAVLLIDRVRFVEAGDPHNINRVVDVVAREAMREQVVALNLSRGDTVVISAEFTGIVTRVGSLPVPDWPGHRAYEYPMAYHALTEIARPGS